jgi:hypothetical protein
MNLQYNLERTVHVKRDEDGASGLSWCLQEHDKEGNPVGERYVPWSWGVDFEIRDLSYVLGTKFRLSASDDFTLVDSIIGVCSLVSGPLNRCQIGMFGTDRLLSGVSITVKAKESAERPELEAYGVPSYQAEDALGIERTDPDYLGFGVLLPPPQFQLLKDLLLKGLKVCGTFRPTDVWGLYSPWSPVVVTDRIKVLTTAHSIIGIDQFTPALPAHVPPRIDDVPENRGTSSNFGINFWHRIRLVDYAEEDERRAARRARHEGTLP